MREERQRKELYVNRREDLYAPEILRKERSGSKKRARRAATKRPLAFHGPKTGR